MNTTKERGVAAPQTIKPITTLKRLLASHLLIAAIGALAACGGSSTSMMDRGETSGPGPMMPERPTPPRAGTSDPLAELDTVGPSLVSKAPVTARDGQIRVGLDTRPATTPARTVERDGTTINAGPVRDGRSAQDILAYLEDAAPFADNITVRRPVKPYEVLIANEARGELFAYVARAVDLLNAALPADQRLTLTARPAPPHDDFAARLTGEVYIAFRDLPEGVAGKAESNGVDGRTTHTYISLDRSSTFDRITYAINNEDRQDRRDQLVHHIAHELVHAIGLVEHPDKVRFADSMMAHSLRWNPGDALFAIDRDVLAASHQIIALGGDKAAVHEDLGAWNQASMHLMSTLEANDAETVAYGVRIRHGFAEGWAEGPHPHGTLADNRALSGTVTWTGGLLGYTPDAQSVAGDAALAIDLAALTGAATFTALEYWTPGIGASGPFEHASLHYAVSVIGNRFASTSGDAGTVSGAFTGAGHEGMGGVLWRDDLTAGFGGTR